MRRALVLFSGGLDSTTTLYLARREGYEALALIFRYGQRHAIEVARATAEAERLGVPWRIQDLDLRAAGGSALTSDAIAVPQRRDPGEIAASGIPPTYVPARNTIFLAHALAWAEVEGVDDIFLGINAIDYSGYPDCRPDFLEAFARLANLALARTTDGGATLRIHAPLIERSKADIVRLARDLGVDFARTWSCYAPVAGGLACGRCDSCVLRRAGFAAAGIEDSLAYAPGTE